MSTKKAPKKEAPKKAAPKKAAPIKKASAPKKETVQSESSDEKDVKVIPHGSEFIVTEKSPDGGVWKQSIEKENPLEGSE